MPIDVEPRRSGPSTLNEVIERNESLGDKPAFMALRDGEIHPSTRFSYSELVVRARQLAQGLRRIGAGYGQRVGLLASPCAEFVPTVLASMLAGAAAAPINTLFKRRELGDYLDLLEPRALLVDESTVGVALEAFSLMQKHPVLVGVERYPGVDLAVTDLLQSEPAEAWRVSPQDAAIILHTSGTTGLPKAAVRTHGNYSALARMWSDTYTRASDRTLSPAPLYHQAGLITAWLVSFAVGASYVHMERFRAELFWDAVRANQISFISGLMAPAPARLLELPERELDAVHDVRWVMGSSSPPVWRAFEARFKCAMHSGYGSTEATMVTMMSPPDRVETPFPISEDGPSTKFLPCGWPIRGFSDMRVRRPDGSTTDVGELGSLEVRGEAVFGEYLHDPERTAQSFTPDGWFVPGDAAFVDHDGCLYVLGREGEFIRRSGENIAPKEIETVLEAMPGIAEAAVVGIQDERRGAEILACVVPEPEGAPSAEDIFARCREEMAVFKVPRFLEFRASLPHTATLKVQKNKLLQESDSSRWIDRYLLEGRT